MTVRKRDTQYHTYADYLIWSNSYGDELINGTAYVREPPAPARSHQEIVGELKGQTQLTVVPDLSIDWDHMLAKI